MPAKKKTEDSASTAPKSITLAAPHGFIDGEGKHQYWHAGETVTDAATIALLIERRAPIKE